MAHNYYHESGGGLYIGLERDGTSAMGNKVYGGRGVWDLMLFGDQLTSQNLLKKYQLSSSTILSVYLKNPPLQFFLSNPVRIYLRSLNTPMTK